jgi:hypothetical protein
MLFTIFKKIQHSWRQHSWGVCLIIVPCCCQLMRKIGAPAPWGCMVLRRTFILCLALTQVFVGTSLDSFGSERVMLIPNIYLRLWLMVCGWRVWIPSAKLCFLISLLTSEQGTRRRRRWITFSSAPCLLWKGVAWLNLFPSKRLKRQCGIVIVTRARDLIA